MRITKLYIKSYKNLQEFEWELNPESPVAVIVGKNASGKSNLLEAILLIFAQVRTNKTSKEFQFEIQYQDIDQNLIILKNESNDFTCTKNSTPIDVNRVFPKQIVAYYAGITSRMSNIVKEYRGKKDDKDFDIVYTEPVHFRFALLALFGSNLTRVKDDLLAKTFGITELIICQLKIRKPRYITSKEATLENFWLAPDKLKVFFQTLIETGKVENTTNDCTISFSKEELQKLMGSPIISNNESNLFEYLSESYANDYIRTVGFSFKKEGVSKPLTFEDLSEGEKQRIGMRGTVELFLGSETLFLLDEPDAFSHPRWQWDFVPDFIEIFKEGPQSSQIIFVTHSPLVLSTVKDNAFVMDCGKVEPLYGVYGEDVSMSLARMDADNRLKKVEDKISLYRAMIQDGNINTERAKTLKAELVEELGLNHSALIALSPLETLYE